MVSQIKKITSLCLFFLLLSAGIKGWYLFQQGFRFAKILPAYSLFSTWEEAEDFDPSSTKGVYYLDPKLSMQDLDTIFQKPFVFLDKGQQCFAFISQDGNYVLKMIRLDKLRSAPWWYTSLVSDKRVPQKKELSWEKMKDSLCLVKENLLEETAVLAIHMGKTKNFPLVARLVDAFGREKEVSLKDSAFVLQKRGLTLADLLPRASSQQMHDISEKLLKAVEKRALKKIRNKNRRCLKNMGFSEGEVIEIDVTEFFARPQANSSFLPREMEKSLQEYQQYLQKYNVTEYYYFRHKLEEIVASHA